MHKLELQRWPIKYVYFFLFKNCFEKEKKSIYKKSILNLNTFSYTLKKMNKLRGKKLAEPVFNSTRTGKTKLKKSQELFIEISGFDSIHGFISPTSNLHALTCNIENSHFRCFEVVPEDDLAGDNVAVVVC